MSRFTLPGKKISEKKSSVEHGSKQRLKQSEGLLGEGHITVSPQLSQLLGTEYLLK